MNDGVNSPNINDRELILAKTKFSVQFFIKNSLVFVLVLLVMGSTAMAYYFWKKNQSLNQPGREAEATTNERDNLIAAISKFLVLPEDEVPTIATVSDPEILKNQSFFTNARKGDKVLIYSKTKKAILYNPETKKVVEVAPITFGANNLENK